MTTNDSQATTAQMITDLFASNPCNPVIYRYDGALYSYSLDISASDVSISSDHRDNNGTSMDVYLGQTRCINLGEWYSSPDEDEAKEIAALVSRIQDGLDIEWDGSNHVGRLSDDAAEAESELHKLIGVGFDQYGEDGGGLLACYQHVYVDHDLAYEGLRDDLVAIKDGASIDERVSAWSDWSDDGITYVVDHADIREWLEEMVKDAE